MSNLSPEDARELFLWRWKDITRANVNTLLKEFKKFDLHGNGELEEDRAMMLMEARGETKTALGNRHIRSIGSFKYLLFIRVERNICSD
jgi:hypothetical protein